MGQAAGAEASLACHPPLGMCCLPRLPTLYLPPELQMGGTPQQSLLQEGAREDKGENARMVRACWCWCCSAADTALHARHTTHSSNSLTLAAGCCRLPHTRTTHHPRTHPAHAASLPAVLLRLCCCCSCRLRLWARSRSQTWSSPRSDPRAWCVLSCGCVRCVVAAARGGKGGLGELKAASTHGSRLSPPGMQPAAHPPAQLAGAGCCCSHPLTTPSSSRQKTLLTTPCCSNHTLLLLPPQPHNPPTGQDPAEHE